MFKTIMTAFILIISYIALSGCALIPVYRPDIQQGNVYTPEMIAQIRPGMTETQVRYIMGTPVLVNTFNTYRWDYVYTFQHGKCFKENRRYTITFDNGQVANIR